MYEYITITVLLLVAGYWILIPFLRRDPLQGRVVQEAEEAVRQLHVKKEGAFAAIRELEFDLNMGKLSRGDYESLKQKYKLEAIHYMREMDKVTSAKPGAGDPGEKELEIEIEGEIAEIRKRRSLKKISRYCTQCGAKTRPGTHYCSECGSEFG